MTELLFIRHGETDWNRRACFQGQIDVPLNGNGRLQAERLGARLAAEPHDLLFSSDLQRAQQTAAPLAAAWRQQPVLVPGLREQGFGEWEGLGLPHHPGALPGPVATVARTRARFRDARRRERHAVPRPCARGREVAGGAGAGAARGRGHTRRRARHAVAHRARPALGGPACLRDPHTGINRLRWVDGSVVVDAWADDEHVRDLLLPT